MIIHGSLLYKYKGSLLLPLSIMSLISVFSYSFKFHFWHYFHLLHRNFKLCFILLLWQVSLWIYFPSHPTHLLFHFLYEKLLVVIVSFINSLLQGSLLCLFDHQNHHMSSFIQSLHYSTIFIPFQNILFLLSWRIHCHHYLEELFCFDTLLLSYFFIVVNVFLFCISVPAKAIELYLDLRRPIEEQIRVCIIFQSPSCLCFMLLYSTFLYSLSSFFPLAWL